MKLVWNLVQAALLASVLGLGCGGGDEVTEEATDTEQATGGEETPADPSAIDPATEPANPCGGDAANPCGEAPAP